MATHLPHRPHLPQTRRARTATVVGAALLACAAIATPFVVRGAHQPPTGSPGAAATPRRDSAVLPRGALRGDVDGDGVDDVVSLRHGDVLRAELGSGRSVRQLLQDRPRINVAGMQNAIDAAQNFEDAGRQRFDTLRNVCVCEDA